MRQHSLARHLQCKPGQAWPPHLRPRSPAPARAAAQQQQQQQSRPRSMTSLHNGDIVMRPLGPPRPGTTSAGVTVIDVEPIRTQPPNDTAKHDRSTRQVPSASGAAPSSFAGGMPAYYFAEDTTIPLDTGFEWAEASYDKRARSIKIWSFILWLRLQLFLIDKPWAYVGGISPQRRAERTRSLAAWVRETLLYLGPLFIKLGQLFSTRADLFPAEFVSELSQLQDRVPAFSAEKAIAVIEADLGRPVDQIFARFDRKPIAAASLGQVHRAVLHSGAQVVVKVQRPGLKELFEIDLETLGSVAEVLDKQDDSGRSDFRGIYKECATILFEEIDYIREGRNADRFRRNFKGVPWVNVPIVYWQHCSPRVLVSSYEPGIKITNVPALRAVGIDPVLVARRATESLLLQLLQHGLYHSDPHPGNLAITLGRGGEPVITYYDFGMMGEIKANTRELLLDTFYAFYRKDVDAVVKALTELGIIVPTGDTISVRRALSFFIDNLNQEVIGEDLFAIALDQPFRFPASFTFVLRAFSTLEGIGKALDPSKYSFVEVAQPYAQELLDLEDQRTLLLSEFQRQAQSFGEATLSMPSRVERMDGFLERLQGGDMRLRVRVLEAERAARRASVLQQVTLQAVGAVGLLNVGVNLALAGQQGFAWGAFLAMGVCSVGGVLGLRRIGRLDKFERQIKG